MGQGRAHQKKKRKSTRKNRRSLEDRHRLGISATVRAKRAKESKNK